MDSRLAKNLAKLDKVGRRTTVFVSSLDRRMLQTSNVLKGRTWFFQAHGQCEPKTESSLSSTPGSEINEVQADSAASTATDEISPEDLCPHDFIGRWLDSNGNTIQVTPTGKSWMMARLSRLGQRQLRLNLWRSEGTSRWICGNAQLEECARDQLLWRFGNGRTSTWVRSEAVGNNQAWQQVSLEDGYGPWQTLSAEKCVQQAMDGKEGSGEIISLSHLAKMISNGMVDTMLVPEKQPDGSLLFVSLTDEKLKEIVI